MILRCEFIGVDCRQGRAIGDGWSILGDYSTPLDLFMSRADRPATYAAGTRCLRFRVQVVNDDAFMVHGFVSIQNGKLIRHARFFWGVSDQWKAIEAGRPVEIAAMGTGSGYGSAGAGGVARITPRESAPEMTEEQRRAECGICDQFTGDACRLLRCCRQKEPKPARWREALKFGACPLGKWGGDAAAAALRYPMRPSELTIGGIKYATM